MAEIQYIIPLQPIPAQRIKVQLAQQRCEIRVFQRDDCVFVDLYKNNEALRLGALARNRLPITELDDSVFTGELFFVDTRLDGANPDYTGFGSRFQLYFAYDDGED